MNVADVPGRIYGAGRDKQLRLGRGRHGCHFKYDILLAAFVIAGLLFLQG